MVYYCSVKGCKNNSKMKKKDPSIVLSFHAFPVKQVTKQTWLTAIGRPSWDPPNFARICSAHFDLEQISHEGCRIRVLEDAYPVIGLPPNSNFEASDIEVCRICLATDLKMFSLQEGTLNTCLQSFAGLKENISIDGLPQFVCYECSARLINCYNLVEQCSIAQTVLLDLFTKNGQVSKVLVKAQDRKALGLESSLQCFNISNKHEYTFYEEYPIVNKMNDAPKIKIENCSTQIKTSLDTFNEVELAQRDFGEELTADLKIEFDDDLMSEKDDVEFTNKNTNITKENPKFPCEECDIDFASEEVRRIHLLTSKQHRKALDLCNPTPPNSKTTCSKCGIQFSTTKELITHLRAEHPRQKRISANTGYPAKCEHCEEMMNSKAEHWLHVRLRHPDKKHSYRAQHKCICQRCGKLFQNSTKLHIHELRHSPAKLRCVHCSRLFHDKYALSRHARTHARATHTCTLCARAFVSKHNLTRHQRVHTGETPYSCNLCSKQFKHSTSQRLHVQSVHCNLPAKKRNKIVI